jgi:hypothetical protein
MSFSLALIFDAFSLREPASTSLENALLSRESEGGINMPATAGKGFQTAVIYRPVLLEISPRSSY